MREFQPCEPKNTSIKNVQGYLSYLMEYKEEVIAGM